ncbi:hypothetical protein GCM10020295_71080 [Streptomyces cinereospinus]
MGVPAGHEDGSGRPLRALAGEHTGTLMAGRTLALHAVPTTFGLKAVGWLVAVDGAAERLRRLRAEGLVVQLGARRARWRGTSSTSGCTGRSGGNRRPTRTRAG